MAGGRGVAVRLARSKYWGNVDNCKGKGERSDVRSVLTGRGYLSSPLYTGRRKCLDGRGPPHCGSYAFNIFGETLVLAFAEQVGTLLCRHVGKAHSLMRMRLANIVVNQVGDMNGRLSFFLQYKRTQSLRQASMQNGLFILSQSLDSRGAESGQAGLR